MFFESVRSSNASTPVPAVNELSDIEKDGAVQALRESIGADFDHLSFDQLKQYLAANAWNQDDAEAQLVETLRWRRDEGIDQLPVATKANGLPLLVSVRGYKYVDDGHVQSDPRLSESAVRILNYMGGDCFHKFDKEGHPILIDRTGYHQSKEIGADITGDELTKFQVSCNEFLNRVIMVEASERAQRTIDRETLIFDCSNVGLWQFHMAGLMKLKLVAGYVQTYYPETLHRLFVVNAPSAFLVMWKVIKPWLDKRTLDKVHILGKDYKQDLLKYIDADALPEFLGGTCTCSHLPGGCVPSVTLGNIPYLEKTKHNHYVDTPYNTDIVEKAKQDDLYCNICTDSPK
ncbi:CRAL-TRIO domain-containing protein [Gongronella butleri]|nr:CRAL-TRIO domain-containing protein [Gongronella butleri]